MAKKNKKQTGNSYKVFDYDKMSIDFDKLQKLISRKASKPDTKTVIVLVGIIGYTDDMACAAYIDIFSGKKLTDEIAEKAAGYLLLPLMHNDYHDHFIGENNNKWPTRKHITMLNQNNILILADNEYTPIDIYADEIKRQFDEHNYAELQTPAMRPDHKSMTIICANVRLNNLGNFCDGLFE